MKIILLLCAFVFGLMPITSIGQTTKIDSTGWYYGYGKVKMKTGETIEDTLNFSFAEYKIRVVNKLDESGVIIAPMKISPKDVEWFTIKDTRFVPVRTTNSTSDEFMIPLTPDDYKLQLFKRYELSEDKTKIVEVIFVKLPGKEKVVNIMTDISLMPFHKKVSGAIADCPGLAGKISGKEEGYKLTMIATQTDYINMYMKVADEYQACK